jgi:RNA polymerase sigma-70 factor, ECF subfamily
MRSYRLPLVGFVLPLVNGDVQAAEDVVQETLLRGWQHARELNPESAGSWLHAMAHNIAISTYHWRRRARPREIPLDENALPTTDDGLDRMFDSWLVAKALNSISPEHRAVIVELFINAGVSPRRQRCWASPRARSDPVAFVACGRCARNSRN